MEELQKHLAVLEIEGAQDTYPVASLNTLTIHVRCPEGCDLRGGTILIGTAEDTLIAEELLTEFDEGVNKTASFEVQMPTEPGEYTWNIDFIPFEALPESEEESQANDSSESEEEPQADNPSESGEEPQADGSLELGEGPHADNPSELEEEPQAKDAVAFHEIIRALFTFSAVPHKTGMSVWRANAPVPCGGDLLVSVGVQCIAGCDLTGKTLFVYDGATLQATALLEEPLPATPKLYQAQLSLVAPSKEGLYEWTCVFDGDDIELPHEKLSRPLTFTVAQPPESVVAVDVYEEKSHEPVAGTCVTLREAGKFPYQMRCDRAGHVEFAVPRGSYHITASQTDHKSTETDLLVEDERVSVSLEILYIPDLDFG
jgi:hypothetical protein